jgi:hypothetical protein
METTMAAIETALAVTLLPHFIADPPLQHDMNFPITNITSHGNFVKAIAR